MINTPGNAPFILFVTGTSGSGKSTLYENLRKDRSLSKVKFHDLDENGVPEVGRGPWRKFRVEQLLYEAVRNYDNSTSTVICGIIKPHEVIESRYFKPSYNVHFLLIETPYEVVAQRIKERVQDQPKEVAFDKRFNPDAMDELLLSSKNLLRELKHSVSQQKKGYVLDASKLTEQEVLNSATMLIKKLLQQSSIAPSST